MTVRAIFMSEESREKQMTKCQSLKALAVLQRSEVGVGGAVWQGEVPLPAREALLWHPDTGQARSTPGASCPHGPHGDGCTILRVRSYLCQQGHLVPAVQKLQTWVRTPPWPLRGSVTLSEEKPVGNGFLNGATGRRLPAPEVV